MPTNYYEQISKAIERYENGFRSCLQPTSWICDRIEWCWKFRKISNDQKDELCDRIIAVMKGEI